jgi:hypothetical protein
VRSVGWSLTTSTHMTIETSERRPLFSALERQGQTTTTTLEIFVLSAFSKPGVHSAYNTNEYQGISLGVKCGRRVELTALPSVVSNVKVRMLAQHSIPLVSLHDLLRESFTFYENGI